MCNFFSCCSDGRGKLLYFDAKARAALRKDNPKNYEPDSHTSIADYHGYPGKKEDKLNKYEFNPLTREFTIDQINTKDDSVQVGEKLSKLDFKSIVLELIIKPIINPLYVKRNTNVTKHELALLKAWVFVYDRIYDSIRARIYANIHDIIHDNVCDSVHDNVCDSVRASVCDSVRASVCDSVYASVYASVCDSVRASVHASVRASVYASVYASVRASVHDNVCASVYDSACAYISSFFELPQWEINKKRYATNPFQCCIDLWEAGLVPSYAGLVPSYDGKTWRLHAGPKAKIVWEGTL